MDEKRAAVKYCNVCSGLSDIQAAPEKSKEKWHYKQILIWFRKGSLGCIENNFLSNGFRGDDNG